MGIFYTNTTLKLTEQSSVVEFMKRCKRPAYISPVLDGYVVVFDRETEDQNSSTIIDLTSLLSRQLRCVAFTVLVHDGDVFAYWLYQDGKQLDEFVSIPNYFNDALDPEPYGGNALELCEAFEVPKEIDFLHHLFQRLYEGNVNDYWGEGFLIGEDIHKKFVKALKLPSITIETGYYTIENTFDQDDFKRIGLVKC